MKKGTAVLLSMILILGFACAFASAEDVPGIMTEDDIGEQAFAVSLAYWLNEPGEDVKDFVYWDAAGWYAAMQMRIDDKQLLSTTETRDFLRSIGYEGELVLPPSWEEYEIVKKVTGAGGLLNYDFRQHKTMFNAMIGIDTEVHTVMKDAASAVTTITVHSQAGERSNQFLLSFAPNPDAGSRFPYRLMKVESYKTAPEMDSALNFDWELLMQQNSLKTILSCCPSVCITLPAVGENACTWLFTHDGKNVTVNDFDGDRFGTYDRYTFDVIPFPDGKERASVGYMNLDPLLDLYTDAVIQNYFKGFDQVLLNRMENDLIWLDLVSDEGYAQTVAIDRGTLMLREILYSYDGGEPFVTASFDYTRAVPEFNFLKGWDQDLRIITAIWEEPDTVNGGFKYRTETIYLPYDWEYMPYDARYDAYTAYLNPRYIGEYAYPGDVYNYTVYFTSVKG